MFQAASLLVSTAQPSYQVENLLVLKEKGRPHNKKIANKHKGTFVAFT